MSTPRRAARRRARRGEHFEAQLQAPGAPARLDAALDWLKSELTVLDASQPQQANDVRETLAAQIEDVARHLHQRNVR